MRPGYDGPKSFFDILPRGHDKSSLEARIGSWLVVASKNPITGYIVATDKDQGALIVQAAEEEHRHNDWWPIEITKDAIIGPMGQIKVVPADAASAFGFRGDFFIFDELTHWKNQNVWKAVMSGRHKRPSSVICILSNAGLLRSWQHEEYLKSLQDPGWVVYETKGTVASWLKPDDVASARRRLPPSEAARLIDNKWIDPAEEFDYIRRSEAVECEKLGASLGLFYRLRRDPAVGNYIAVIDYGARRDRCVMLVMHQDATLRKIVDRMDVWSKGDERMVSPARVRQWAEDIHKAFAPALFVIDEWQMLATIEWLEQHNIPVEAFNFRGGQGNFQMAQVLRGSIVDRELAWYPGCGQLGDESLVDELSALVVKKMSYGFRFDHERQMHDDRAVALGMGALACPRFPHAEVSKIPEAKPMPDVRYSR